MVQTALPADGASGSAINDGKPDLTPAILQPAAERSEKGARNILIAFARAIELKEFNQAWALLAKADQAKWTQAEFTRMFTGLDTITVAFGDGVMEGAAGSSWYEAPLTMTATDRNGRPVRFDGHAVLRRVNDIEGATPAQLRWHFQSLALDWTH